MRYHHGTRKVSVGPHTNHFVAQTLKSWIHWPNVHCAEVSQNNCCHHSIYIYVMQTTTLIQRNLVITDCSAVILPKRFFHDKGILEKKNVFLFIYYFRIKKSFNILV